VPCYGGGGGDVGSGGGGATATVEKAAKAAAEEVDDGRWAVRAEAVLFLWGGKTRCALIATPNI
jgi:hypothetical protein